MKITNKSVTELQDVTITHVSYVKRGANKRQFLLSKSENKQEPDVEFDVRVVRKEDEAQKLLYGIVYEPDVMDAHGDIMKAEEIEKTANEFLIHYRNIDTEHNLIAGAGQVVQSYIAPCDLTIGKSDVKAGSWILVTKATDEIWQDYLDGEITGYSMFGIARKTVAKTNEKINNVGWIQKALEKLGIVKSFEETLDEVIKDMSTDPFFIMSIMEEDFWKNISWDSTRKEDLDALSKSMREAANYIDGLINAGIVKTETEEAVTETVVEKTSETETEVINNDDTSDVTDASLRGGNATVSETVDNVVNETVPVAEEETETINEEAENLKLENERLQKELDQKQEEIDKLIVKSSVRTISDNGLQQKPKPQPQLF